MTAFLRPCAQALHLLCITFSMLLLAYVLNSRVEEALLLRQTPVRDEPAAPRPKASLDPHQLASRLGLTAPVSREPPCNAFRDPESPGSRPTHPGHSSYVVRRRGPTLFEVSRRREKPDFTCYDPGVRISTVFRDGKAQGFKLFSIRPESLAAQLKLRDQDILRSVNGMALDSPEHALGIYTQLKDASRIELLLERDGKLVRQTYLIR